MQTPILTAMRNPTGRKRGTFLSAARRFFACTKSVLIDGRDVFWMWYLFWYGRHTADRLVSFLRSSKAGRFFVKKTINSDRTGTRGLLIPHPGAGDIHTCVNGTLRCSPAPGTSASNTKTSITISPSITSHTSWVACAHQLGRLCPSARSLVPE